ncbi:hypothetical protein JCM5350_002550 [Sporobolomyces pararoseus]
MSKRQKTTLSDEPIVQRIHVGGLAPSVTPRELVARFSSFGEIKGGAEGVQGLGQAERAGLPRSYAFFNLLTSQAKLQRCMSMLNGSMWKSHKLRIGPAKPDWEHRREEERRLAREAEDPTSTSTSASPNAATKKKKRKLSSDPNVGYTAKRFEVVTPENIENHKGWILDSKPHSSVPLFPLVVRPSHPIYLPPKAASTSWTRGKSSDEKQKKQREKELRQGGETVREKKPLIRIKRIRIDPRKYGRKKIVYSCQSADDDAAGTMTGVGHWECLEDREVDESHSEVRKAGEEKAKDEVTWVFKTNKTGEIKQQETIKLNHRDVAHTDQFKALLEKLQIPECSKAEPTTLDSTVPSSSTQLSTELSKISDPIEALASPPLTSARARSLSPPPYIPSAPRQLLYNEEDAFQLRVSSLDDSTRELEAQKERERLVRLAMGVVEEVVAEPVSLPTKAEIAEDKRLLPKVEGFANEEDESDDGEIFKQQAAMRLRGGGGVSSDSDSDDSDAEGGDAKMPEGGTTKAKTTLVKESLKDMFKPQEEQAGKFTPFPASSFSLFSGLELDLEEERERSPSAEAVSIPIPSALPPPPPRILPVYRQHNRQQQDQQASKGPGYSFFGLLDSEETSLGNDKKRENEKRLKESGVEDWWKNQTQEEIDEAHSKLRESLRGFSRKRHRESVKRTKKKGAGGREGGRRGGIIYGGFTLDSLADE